VIEPNPVSWHTGDRQPGQGFEEIHMRKPACHPTAWIVTLAVGDLTRAVDWYRDVLAFQIVSERPGRTGLPLEARLRRAPGLDLVLMAVPSPEPRSSGPAGASRWSWRAMKI
jgi:Glyoxalase/Bleomycin resistance protein/Dioxygenase superfamily